MKIESKVVNRPLKAVIAEQDLGIFLPLSNGGTVYLSCAGGTLFENFEASLEACLRGSRRGVYAGESITLTF